MSSQFKNMGLVVIGIAIGLLLSIYYISQSDSFEHVYISSDKVEKFSEAFSLIQENYVEELDEDKLFNKAMSSFVSSLDPHSEYLDENAYQELIEGTEGQFVGIGIEVDAQDGLVKIVAPIEGSPAYLAGLKAGDLITHLNDESVLNFGVEEAVKRMRGEPNTSVRLTVSRENFPQALSFTLVRKMIQLQSVKAKLFEPGYAWLRISQFQEPTLKDLVLKINELYRQDSELKGLVLDLRNDPGGLLFGAIGVSSAFLPFGVPIVSTQGQSKNAKEVFYAKHEFYSTIAKKDPLEDLNPKVKKIPLVVLINIGSASASEIVAGALQDYQRASILGTRSFGKGSVQSIIHLSSDTAMKITTSRYYTPNGTSIQAQGITPDFYVEETPNGDGINHLRARESDLRQHLSASKNEKTSTQHGAGLSKKEEEKREKFILEQAKKTPILEYGSANDHQLIQAINHLKGLPVQTSVQTSVQANEK